MNDSSRDGKTIGLCGAGQMGRGVALALKRAGLSVLVYDIDHTKLATLTGSIGAMESWMDQHIGQPLRPEGHIAAVQDLEEIDVCADVVVEAIAEDTEQKVDLFTRLHKCRERQTLLLTTTSGLSITEMGRRSGTGHHLVGTHFWNPAHLMPLVEVVPGRDTAKECVDAASSLVRSTGKVVVLVQKDVPGFIGNRLLHALWREAIDIVETGIASPEDVDLVSRLTFGLRMPALGPLENMDLVGLDLVAKVQASLLPSLSGHRYPSGELERMVASGHLGMKSGRGFYDWSTRSAEETVHRRDEEIARRVIARTSENQC